jgi:outer membrane protein OmpA-like peptidoglycan-associated protein
MNIESTIRSARRASLSLLAAALLVACQTAPTPPAPSTAPAAAAAREAVLVASGFVQTEQGWELNLGASMLFEFDSDILGLAQQTRLKRLAQELTQVGIASMRIEGHTDSVGTADYNLRLSERRAVVVSQTLAGAGMPAQGLAARGFGKDKPIADNTSEQGRLQNRRVVLIVPAI